MTKQPRVAFFDIENSPSQVYVYDYYLRHGGSNVVHTIRPWFMLSFAWQIRGEKQVHCKALCDYPNYQKNLEDDYRLVKDLWNLFDCCDILIAHNGKRFDVRKATTRFLKHKLPPHSPIKIVDTLQLYKRACHMESNRLDAIDKFHGGPGKQETTGFPMHLRCMLGDLAAWPMMKKYNKTDVARLAAIAEPILPWTNAADFRAARSDHECPVCLSNNIEKRGSERTIRSMKQRLHCGDCGKWFSEKIAA